MTPNDDAEELRQSQEGGRAGTGQARRRRMLRWAPLAMVVLAVVLSYALGLEGYLSFGALRRYQQALAAFVAAHGAAAAAAYFVVYVVSVALSFPGASFLTTVGGFMFGVFAGTALAVVAATIGATLIFLIARTSLGAFLAERAGPRAQRLQQGFNEDGFSYLLFLRLVPLFPFWLVNLAAALFGMRLLPYVAATAVGILPGTFVFCYFGRGLESVLKSEQPMVSPGLIIGLVLLGFMALVPVIVRRRRRGRKREREVSARPGI